MYWCTLYPGTSRKSVPPPEENWLAVRVWHPMQALLEEEPGALQRPVLQFPLQAAVSVVNPGVPPYFPAAQGVQSLNAVAPADVL